MGGFGCCDRFDGSPYSTHSWNAARTALKTWSRRTGRGFFVSNDARDGWLAFKTKLPNPKDVLVISAASKEVDYAKITTANHRAYCRRWGHPYHLFTDGDFDRSRRLNWSKIKMLKEALQRHPWVFWIDCDAIFNDWSVPITRLCISPFNLICGIWYFGPHLRPSAGTMMMQQGDWSDTFLDAVWRHKGSHHSVAAEEDAMWSLMKRSSAMRRGLLGIDARELNSPAIWDLRLDDPILHFLQLNGTRQAMLRDACRMAEERNSHSFRAMTQFVNTQE
jgi:galactosyl transferase GMA12/MNN10 family